MKEQLIKEVNEILDAFVKQEIGNKVTQFNMQGLSVILMDKIQNMEEVKKGLDK